MIDMLTLLMIHGLLGLAAVRLILNDSLDSEETSGAPADRASDGPAE